MVPHHIDPVGLAKVCAEAVSHGDLDHGPEAEVMVSG